MKRRLAFGSIAAVFIAMVFAGSSNLPLCVMPIGALAVSAAIGVAFLPRKAASTFDDYATAVAIYVMALFMMLLLYATGHLIADHLAQHEARGSQTNQGP